MNPLDWLKALYEAFGTPYPRFSMTVVVLLGGLLFGGIWHIAKKQVEKAHATPAPTAVAPTGGASTSGAQSPAITGSNNQVTIEQPPAQEQKKEAKDAPKK
jgi:hypothetical protein